MSRYYRNPAAKWREEEESKRQVAKGLETGEDIADIGTSIVLSSGKMHAFNVLATEIWKLCDGKTPGEIISALGEQFDVEHAVLEKDVSAFLDELMELGLIYEE